MDLIWWNLKIFSIFHENFLSFFTLQIDPTSNITKIQLLIHFHDLFAHPHSINNKKKLYSPHLMPSPSSFFLLFYYNAPNTCAWSPTLNFFVHNHLASKYNKVFENVEKVESSHLCYCFKRKYLFWLSYLLYLNLNFINYCHVLHKWM